MSARKTEEEDKEANADEDGPPESDQEAEKNEITDDDDESMTNSEPEVPEHVPYNGFFETREVCSVCALNNALGFKLIKDSDMTNALEKYIATRKQEGLHELRSTHVKSTGWYSREVMTECLSSTSNHRYVLEMKALLTNPTKIHTSVGAIVNKDNKHWLALRSIGGKIWKFNSSEKSPTQLSQNEYVSLINERKASYLINIAEDTSQSTNDSPILPTVRFSLSSDSCEFDHR